MKKVFSLLIPFLIICMFLTSCNAASPEEPQELNITNAEKSEKAMDSFVEKIKKGNYTIEAPNFLKTYAYSEDLVWFDYDEEYRTDFAVMSVNNEVFQAMINDGQLGHAAYLGEGKAMDMARSKLLTNLLYLSDDNLFNFFYNQQDNPLVFVSYDDVLKEAVINIAGYGLNALGLMEEVYLELNDVDPTEAHIKAVVNEDVVARVNYDDIDIKVTFGDAKDNELAEAWMKNPVYPQAKTDWDNADIFVLNSVFLTTEGETILPFPKFASYAFNVDGEHFLDTNSFDARDAHASQSDMKDYIDLLLDEGFRQETDENGDTVYRRVLREDYKCYTSVFLEYDNGVNLVAKKYYDFPRYDTLENINDRLTYLGYVPLPESDNFEAIEGIDRAVALTESWLYFFDYDSSLYVEIDFKDQDKMQEYLDAYDQALVDAGFVAVYAGNSGNPEDFEYYEAPTGRCNYRYQLTGDNHVSLLYKAEKYIPAVEAEKMILGAGFPRIKLSEPITCRDLTRFYKAQYNLDLKKFVTLSQQFDSAAEAEEFLNAYEQLLNNAGFERVNPQEVGCLKEVAIYNEEKGMMVGVDFYEQQGGAQVNLDFKAE